MIGSIFLFLIFHSILFSFIFWFLTFLGKLYYTNVFFNKKFLVYECGFKQLTITKITYNINFCLILFFIILYDGEFLFLIPFALNITYFSINMCFTIFIFLILLIFTLYIDILHNVIEWQL